MSIRAEEELPNLARSPTDGIDVRFKLQWFETIRGYVVDVAEGAAFLVLVTVVNSQ
jgi:hypothetical protein